MPPPTSNAPRSQRHHKIRKSSRPRRSTTSTISTTATNEHLEGIPEMSQHQCCGVVEEAALQAREKRLNRTKPQPWIARKLVVFLTLGIMGYAGYVYVGRFCVSALKGTNQSSTGRPTAIALLVVFCVLYLWMIWAYIKVVLTSPGYAKDHIPKSRQPFFEVPDTRHSDYDLENSLTNYNTNYDHDHSKSLEFDPTRTHRYNKPSHSSTSSHQPHGNRHPTADPIAGPSYEDIVLRSSTHSHGRSMSVERLGQAGQTGENGDARRAIVTPTGEVDDGGVGEGRLRTPFEAPFTIYLPEHEQPHPEPPIQSGLREEHALELGTLGGREPRDNLPQTPETVVPPPPPLQVTSKPAKPRRSESPWRLLLLPFALCSDREGQTVPRHNKGPLPVRRRPSTIPVLHPAHRYCYRDQLVRPYRAHHCRNCGTCVLKFDHHCPWIGQCVGARNHKFFLNFCLAAAIFCLYVLGTLVGFNVSAWASTSSSAQLDPQIVVISALAALFALFTTVLTWTHIILILRGQTTVESMSMHSTKEREAATLTREYGFCGLTEKREAKRQWNEEWGDLDTEGNIWWTGSKKQGWIDVMGSNPLGWICELRCFHLSLEPCHAGL